MTNRRPTISLLSAAPMLLFCFALSPQAIADTLQVDTPRVSQVTGDTLRAPSRADSAFVEILEKTNQQLSLWWNPYGVMIAGLGVLFTIAAITVGLALFRQGREYRSMIDRSIAEYKAILNAFIEDKNAQIQVEVDRISEHVETKLQELDSATGDEKERLEKEIADLQKLEKALRPHHPTLGPSAGASATDLSPLTSHLLPITMAYVQQRVTQDVVCSACGHKYKAILLVSDNLATPVICPHCGHSQLESYRE